MAAMPRVLVAGGSLGGLTAALVLADVGCDVRVFERSSAALEARGAGIATLDATLRYLTERGGYRPRDVCSATGWIRFLNRDGSVRHQQRHRYHFSSWTTVHRALLRLFGTDRYRLGHEVVAFEVVDDTVRVRVADGSVTEVDLLVCADGVNSPARARLLPEVTPSYAGYVAWRGTLAERDLTPASFATLRDAITYQVLDHSHVLVYPIPGLDGSLAEGERLTNVVWYVNVSAGPELDALLTDRDGVRRTTTFPPGAVREDAVGAMRRTATAVLAPQIAEVVTGVEQPFVQVIHDIKVPRMAWHRVCLLGDAAFAVRPHAAASTAKAAADGWALAEELQACGGDVPTALARWERRQLDLGRRLLARARRIGDSSQFAGTFLPGDPQLIFGLYEPGR